MGKRKLSLPKRQACEIPYSELDFPFSWKIDEYNRAFWNPSAFLNESKFHRQVKHKGLQLPFYDFCPLQLLSETARHGVWLLAPDTCVLSGMHVKDCWQLVTWEPRSTHEKYLPLFFCVFSCTLTLTRNIILYPDFFSSYDFFNFQEKNKGRAMLHLFWN